MANSSFGHRFHDLKYFEVGFFSIFLEFIINLRENSQRFFERNQFNIILSWLKQILDDYVFNLFTCTLLALSSKICRLFLKKFGNINCLII